MNDENITKSTIRAPELSVVVPVYNEEGNITALTRALTMVLSSLCDRYEIILVDDGSSDGSWQLINEIGKENPAIKGISFSRNFGFQHALLCGLTFSQGNAIISMDGDMQHPPEMIPTLYNLWKQGYKVINTQREDIEVAGVFKRFTSKWFYKLFSLLTNVPMSAGSSDFRLIDRNVLDTLIRFNDIDLFIRGSISWLNFSTKTISFKANERLTGKTKFNFKKMMLFAAKAIMSFSTKPLQFGIWLGLATSTIAFLELVFIIIKFFQGVTVPGWASSVGIVAFLFGILFIILGIIGSYIAKIYQVLQNRPRFVISEKVNMDQRRD